MCQQVVVVLQQVFALIQTVLGKWLNDSQVVEVRHLRRPSPAPTLDFGDIVPTSVGSQVGWMDSTCAPQAVCAIFEKSVKTLLHNFAPMVSQLSQMLGQMYSTIPQASALDLTRQVGFGFLCSWFSVRKFELDRLESHNNRRGYGQGLKNPMFQP